MDPVDLESIPPRPSLPPPPVPAVSRSGSPYPNRKRPGTPSASSLLASQTINSIRGSHASIHHSVTPPLLNITHYSALPPITSSSAINHVPSINRPSPAAVQAASKRKTSLTLPASSTDQTPNGSTETLSQVHIDSHDHGIRDSTNTISDQNSDEWKAKDEKGKIHTSLSFDRPVKLRRNNAVLRKQPFRDKLRCWSPWMKTLVLVVGLIVVVGAVFLCLLFLYFQHTLNVQVRTAASGDLRNSLKYYFTRLKLCTDPKESGTCLYHIYNFDSPNCIALYTPPSAPEPVVVDQPWRLTLPTLLSVNPSNWIDIFSADSIQTLQSSVKLTAVKANSYTHLVATWLPYVKLNASIELTSGLKLSTKPASEIRRFTNGAERAYVPISLLSSNSLDFASDVQEESVVPIEMSFGVYKLPQIWTLKWTDVFYRRETTVSVFIENVSGDVRGVLGGLQGGDSVNLVDEDGNGMSVPVTAPDGSTNFLDQEGNAIFKGWRMLAQDTETGSVTLACEIFRTEMSIVLYPAGGKTERKDASIGAKRYTHIVAFGDSVSDNGNLFRLTNGQFPQPPSFQGRFSNGPVWVEYLAQNLNAQLSNFAYAGAVSTQFNLSPGPANDMYRLSPDLASQFQLFQQARLTGQIPQSDPDNTLYTIFAGGNDAVALLKAGRPLNSQLVSSTLVQLTQNLVTTMGARNILILNSGRLDVLPQIQRDMQLLGVNRAQELIAYQQQVNLLTSATIQQMSLQFPGVTIYQGNLRLLTDILSTPEGLLNNGFIEPFQGCLVEQNGRTISLCPNPNQFVSWDGLHPTTRVHEMLANEMTRLVLEQSIQFSTNGNQYRLNRNGNSRNARVLACPNGQVVVINANGNVNIGGRTQGGGRGGKDRNDVDVAGEEPVTPATSGPIDAVVIDENGVEVNGTVVDVPAVADTNAGGDSNGRGNGGRGGKGGIDIGGGIRIGGGIVINGGINGGINGRIDISACSPVPIGGIPPVFPGQPFPSQTSFPPGLPTQTIPFPSTTGVFPSQTSFPPGFPSTTGAIPSQTSFPPGFPSQTSFPPGFPSPTSFPPGFPSQTSFPPGFPSQTSFPPGFPSQTSFPPGFPSSTSRLPNGRNDGNGPIPTTPLPSSTPIFNVPGTNPNQLPFPNGGQIVINAASAETRYSAVVASVVGAVSMLVISNGPVWVEYLAQTFNNATLWDAAVAGAVISHANLHGAAASDSMTNRLPDMEGQIALMAQKMSEAEKSGFDQRRTLYIVFAGINDFVINLTYGSLPVPKEIVESQMEFIKLSLMGTFQVSHLLVVNIPALENTPYFPSLLMTGRIWDSKAEIVGLLEETNRLLKDELEALQVARPSNLRIYHGDIHTLYRQLNDPTFLKTYNLTSGNLSCLEPDGTLCSNPENYIHYEPLHPTTRAHEIFAEVLGGVVVDGLGGSSDIGER
ncbi:hypothetical protein HDV05_005513 [Chytridiales sp. JEL 0842]|nr:hypothetical protein HDV05_005513 [Chytridiales sp. JEL 0842]